MQSILLFAPAGTARADRGASAYAIDLAQAFNAHLTLLVVDLDVAMPGSKADPRGVADALCNAARKAGVECVAITEHSHAIGIHDVLAEHARLHDVTVMGCSRDGLLSESILLERVLFDSGRPLIVIPRDFRATSPLAKIAIGWDNTAAAARALGDAKPLILGRSAVFLTIDGDKQLRGDVGRSALIEAAERRGIDATVAVAARGNRDIGEALQAEAQALGADLLVMGGYGHSTFKRIVLGSATGGILDALRMPVLMSH